ncbi:MAG TPA: dihydrofolate reductase family protein [Gemmatimonadales bacterium]|nr:dihydrofolate reductase family protein [Gemmatimonadales bacterium]
MRRILMFNHVTLDGYFAGADGNLTWIVPDEGIDRDAVQRMPSIDTILLGRRTYQLFEAFWPHAVDDSATASDPHDSSRRSPTLRSMAVWINETTKLVFSRSLKKVTWKNSRIIREIDPRAIEVMKGERGKDMIVFGSGSVVSELTRHRLIDEYQFVLNPVLLGSGKPMMESVSKRVKLDLIEAKEFSSGNLVLRYAAEGVPGIVQGATSTSRSASGGTPRADRHRR